MRRRTGVVEVVCCQTRQMWLFPAPLSYIRGSSDDLVSKCRNFEKHSFG